MNVPWDEPHRTAVQLVLADHVLQVPLRIVLDLVCLVLKVGIQNSWMPLSASFVKLVQQQQVQEVQCAWDAIQERLVIQRNRANVLIAL